LRKRRFNDWNIITVRAVAHRRSVQSLTEDTLYNYVYVYVCVCVCVCVSRTNTDAVYDAVRCAVALLLVMYAYCLEGLCVCIGTAVCRECCITEHKQAVRHRGYAEPSFSTRSTGQDIRLLSNLKAYKRVCMILSSSSKVQST
jgi:hypothetical protein